ncbi:flagellar basal body P-ring formation chaperone FlgA [bacterium]|nr:flagellar basal body P-ring formation chaperone FlgA [bacterium]MBU1638465.1 flagellar basal body P-ring formation chaperone FlgA [bacterium]
MPFLLALILISCSALANEPEAIIERLVAEAWKPLTVRVEWTFRESSRRDLKPGIEYAIANPKPIRLAGNLTLKLEGSDASGKLHSLPVIGQAQIFGDGFTVIDYISAGENIEPEQVRQTELEWTRLNGQPVTDFGSEADLIAVRGLVPGRTICIDDLKAAPVIRKDQPVTLELSDNLITISLAGRALKDGAVGEEIPVSVELEHTKRYRGIVVDKTTVRFIQ